MTVAAALFSFGCAGAAVPSGGGSTASALVASGLNATPPAVSFGNVRTGSSSTQSVAVSNGGAAPLSVAQVGIAGAGFSASDVPSGLTLVPGQTAAFSVTFAPASAGNMTGSVTVSDSSSSTPLAVTLSGTGVPPIEHFALLTWNASPSVVAGYRAYRATNPSGPYSVLNASPIAELQWKDSTVQSGTTYYYVVAAVAADAGESGYSNQVSAVVPEP